GREQCRRGWPFINGLRIHCLCGLPGSAGTEIRCLLCPPDTVKHRCRMGPHTRSRSCDHIGESVIKQIVSKMSLVPSLLTTCEICE
ncbi:unnamed protein product, partial [Staurois parvus]